MARKDFDDYYNKISSQLFELDKVFKELEREVSSGMVEPERIEQLKVTIEPIRNSYHTLSYIKYLLDRPTKKSKHKRYEVQSKALLKDSAGYHRSDIVGRNDRILKGLRTE